MRAADAGTLYLLLGCVNCMMGVAVAALGYLPAGEELLRAGYAYAAVIGHRPLMAKLRLELAYIAYWDAPRQARDLAASGLELLSKGPNAAHLQLLYGRASGRAGDADAARRAVADAHEARSADYRDELLEMGGEFSVSLATHHYFAGSALTEAEGAGAQAAAELEEAGRLYAAGPGDDEQHWFGGRSMTGIDLAAVQLGSGGLDGAVAALEPVLSLPPGQRIMEFAARLGRVRGELARSRYQGSAQARELDARIEEFCRESVTSDLRALPGSG
jgi:hypothetical protein